VFCALLIERPLAETAERSREAGTFFSDEKTNGLNHNVAEKNRRR